jgi:hypothetical protein
MHARPVFVSLLFAASLAAGCATNVEKTDADFSTAGFQAGPVVITGGGLPPAPTDRKLLLAGKKPGGLGFVQNTPDTWGPFDVQVRTGFLDLEQMDAPAGVRVCLEIDNVGFSIFYDVCATHDGVDWTVAAFKGAPVTAIPGSIELDADEIELRAEQVGGDVNFFARVAGAMAWTPVSTTAFAAQTEPLKAAVGATGLSKGTAVGFDDLIYVSSGPPVAPAPAVAVAADANAALLAGYAAYRDLEGGLLDLASAATNLADAAAALDDALAGVAALPESKTVKSAAKLLGKADKGLAKAQDQVADGAAEKALKTLEKAAAALIEAALLLNPQPLGGP